MQSVLYIFVASTFTAQNTDMTFSSDAYYTEDALEHLHTVDDIPVLADMHVPHECYQRARASGSSSSSNVSVAKKPVVALSTDSEVSARRERINVTTTSPPNAFHRFAPFPASPISTVSSPRGTSRGRTSPSGGRVSPINALMNGNVYKTAYSYPLPPPGVPFNPASVDLHPRSQPHTPAHLFPKAERHTHTPPSNVYLPPLFVPSQVVNPTHSHPSSSTSSASSISSSPSSTPPALSHSATTATPTSTTDSPYIHRYPLPPPASLTPSPCPSDCIPPTSARTPPPSLDCRSGGGRTLVPLAALRLSDTKANTTVPNSRKRYKMDEEALRAFKSF